MTRSASGLDALGALALACICAAWALRGAWGIDQAVLVGDPDHPDTLANHWLLDWTAAQVRSGAQLWFTDAYFWPVGDRPVLAGNGMDGVLAAPVLALWPWPVGAVVYAALQRTLDGISGWSLGRALGLRQGPALVLVPALALSPTALTEASAGRWTQAGTWPLVLTLAAGLRLVRAPTAAGALALALALACCGALYWYYAWFSVLCLGVVAALIRPRGPTLRAATLGLTGGLALLAPWLWAFVQSWAQIPGTGEDPAAGGQRLREAIPEVWALVRAAPGPAQAACISAPLLGWAVVGLAWRPTRLVRPLAVVLLVFLALAAGDRGPASPFALVYDSVPLLRRFWWPLRHFVVVHALVAVLGAMGIAALTRGRPAWSTALSVATAGAIPLAASLQGAPDAVVVRPIPWPQAAWVMLAAQGPGAVVQPPLSPEASGSGWPLMAQRAHGHPTVAGHAPWVARGRPAAWDHWAQQNPAIASLQAIERGERATLHGAELHALGAAGAPWMVLDRGALPLSLQGVVRGLDAALRTLCGRPLWRDQGVQLWDLRRCDAGAQVVVHSPWPEGVRPGGPELPLQGRWPAR